MFASRLLHVSPLFTQSNFTSAQVFQTLFHLWGKRDTTRNLYLLRKTPVTRICILTYLAAHKWQLSICLIRMNTFSRLLSLSSSPLRILCYSESKNEDTLTNKLIKQSQITSQLPVNFMLRPVIQLYTPPLHTILNVYLFTYSSIYSRVMQIVFYFSFTKLP